MIQGGEYDDVRDKYRAMKKSELIDKVVLQE